MKYKVFTLIELLTVIAICAIMAAILMPALHSAQRHAQSISCVGNLRQIVFSFLMYAADSKDKLPPYMENSIYGHGGTSWAWYTYDYHNDVNILDCPVSKQGAPEPTREGLHLQDGNYGWNYDGTQGNRGSLRARIPKPSRAYLVFDSGDQCVIYGANNWTNLMEELDLDWDSRTEGPNRHNNYVNISFVDGHVHKLKLDDFIAAPNKYDSIPWHIEWTTPVLQKQAIPFPLRE